MKKPVLIIGMLITLSLVSTTRAQVTYGGGHTLGGKHNNKPPTAFVFVSPTGNDSNDCLSSSAACLTPQHATTVVDAQSATHKIVQFADGHYYLGSTWALGSGDSGTSTNHVQYRAAPGATPVISGAIAVTGWANCDGVTHCKSLPAGAFNCTGCGTPVFVQMSTSVPFEALYYNGARRYRPRSPYTDPATGTGSWYCVPGITSDRLTIEPCTNGSPAAGTLYVLCGASLSSFFPTTGPCPATNGNNKACYACVLRDPVDTQTVFHGVTSLANGGGCTAASTCTKAHEVEIVKMEKWTAFRMPLSPDDNDGTNHVSISATLLPLTGLPSSGVGAGSCVPGICNFGPLAGHNYFLDNVVEAMTHKQQWYFDRCPASAACINGIEATGELIYIPATGENPSADLIEVPQIVTTMTGSNATNIDFVGLTFAGDNLQVTAAGIPGLSDLSNVAAANSFTNPVGINFISDTFRNMMHWALEMKGSNGVTQTGIVNSVLGNDLYDLGTGGIRIGLTEAGGDTTANVAQYVLVENSRASYGQLFMPNGTGTAFWIGNSFNNQFINDSCDYWYNGCYGVGGSQGFAGGGAIVANNNTLQFLECSNVGMGVTSDMGCLHTHTGSATGNTLDGFVFHDVVQDQSSNFYYVGYNGSCGPYIDNSSSNWTVTRGLTYNCGEEDFIINSAVDGLGQNNSISNSIFAYAIHGVIKKAADTSVLQLTMTHNISYFDKGNSHNGPQCGDTTCPGSGWLDPTKWSFSNNTYFNSANSLGSGTPFYSGAGPTSLSCAGWQALNSGTNDAGSTCTVDPGFVSPGTRNFAFSGAAPSGFTPFTSLFIGARGLSTLPASAASYGYPITVLGAGAF